MRYMALARSGVILPRPKLWAKSSSVQKQVTKNDLDILVEKSSKVIFQTKSVYPFDYFPNLITITPDKITVTSKQFLLRTEYPLLLDSVTGSRVGMGWFFATLYIDTFGVKDPPPPINYLRKSDARQARRYILALIECKKSNLDLGSYSLEELREKLLKIGRVREGDSPDNLKLRS